MAFSQAISATKSKKSWLGFFKRCKHKITAFKKMHLKGLHLPNSTAPKRALFFFVKSREYKKAYKNKLENITTLTTLYHMM